MRFGEWRYGKRKTVSGVAVRGGAVRGVAVRGGAVRGGTIRGFMVRGGTYVCPVITPMCAQL